MGNVSIGCRSCGKKVLMDQMKYDPDNRKNLICPECYNTKVSKRDNTSRAKKVLISMNDRQKPVQGSGVQYKCSNCGYSFKRSTLSKQSNICPYCNKPAASKVQIAGFDWAKDIE